MKHTAVFILTILLCGWSQLTLAVPPNPFAGVYKGTSQHSAGSISCENGEFSFILKTDGNANALKVDIIDQTAVVIEGVIVNNEGSFSANDIDVFGTDIIGTFTSTGVSGTFSDAFSCFGTFTGTKKPGTGPLAEAGGYYTGTASGNLSGGGLAGTTSGPLTVIIAADGSAFFVSNLTASGDFFGTVADGGNFNVSSTGSVSGTSLGGTTISGSLNTTALTGNGTFSATIFVPGVGTVTHTGTWSVTRQFPLPTPIVPSVINDFNADSTSDLLIHNTFNGAVASGPIISAVLSSPAFVLLADPVTGWTLSGTGDFNGDRKADVLLFNTTTGELRVVLLDGSTIISDTIVAVLPAGIGLEPKGIGDIDGDGKSDILLFHAASGFTAGVLMDGASIVNAAPLTTVDVDNFFTLFDTGDFNGDGKDDLLLFGLTNKTISYVPLDGLNTPGTEVDLLQFGPRGSARPVGVGDFNNDGKADLLISDIPNPDPAGTLSVSLQDGVTIVSTHVVSDNFSRDLSVLNAGDYDGDGKSDVLFFNTSTGHAGVLLLDGATPLSAQSVILLDPASGWTLHSGKP